MKTVLQNRKKMSKSLFSDFEGVSSKAWKQKIQVDLKGADYNETLIWKTNEGIDVKPFYHADQFEGFSNISNNNTQDWKICQAFVVEKTEEANAKAIDAINRGAEAILFIVSSESISSEELLKGIDLDKVSIDIKCSFLSIPFSHSFNKKNVIIQNDIIGHLAKTGNWYKNLKEDHDQFEAIVKINNQLCIDLDLYQNAGANIVQQLAYGLAHANEYLNHFDKILDSNKKQDLVITFNVAIGSNYFFEIAKLRALRNLWVTLASEYGFNTNCRIKAIPSKRNKTIYDYNVNMLRTTTECMSAILGGADVISNLPYDALYHNANEFGDRISRNQLLILKNESYFDKVSNPSDGAYYIEHLTQKLSEKALDLFKNIEINGGFLSQLKEGTIQRKIKESASKEQSEFDNEQLILLGTNKHPNPADKMINELEVSPFLRQEKRRTLIEPIIKVRLSEKLEINRLNNE